MAQQQHAADVHPAELCPPNKRYDLLDANKKVDLEHVQCLLLTRKELTLTLDDFRQIFHLPQATANIHYSFVPPPSFFDMVPFYKQVFGIYMELKTLSNFKTTSPSAPCKTLCKIYVQMLNNTVLEGPTAEAYNATVILLMSKTFMWIIPQLTESIHGTPKTTSTPRPPNPNNEVAESSAPRRSTVIRLRLPEKRSTRLTPLVPVPIVNKADEMILQDTLQVSLTEHKSHEEQEAMRYSGTSPESDTEKSGGRGLPKVKGGGRITPVNGVEITPAVRPRDQDDPHDDAHPEGRKNDDEIPMKQVSEDIMEEVLLTIDEANPEKFSVIIFNDDDIKERTSRWVNTCVKKFNPYARYGVKHWNNPYAKIFYIRKQKETGKPKKEIYSNLKIVQVIKTYWELGHEHKFITKIIARRANDCIISITEPDYKNLNKNDIEDIYLLIMNGKVPDYADTGYQHKVNLTAPTITFPGIEEHDMFSIIYEPVHGIIYKNSKKEKRAMRHTEIHKFCDVTLNRVLEGLKSYNNDIKYGYVQKDLTKDETEYLKLFEEEIEERLKHRR
ncbi:hypothetical protein Tco_1107731 [Tanacetum coccineum]